MLFLLLMLDFKKLLLWYILCGAAYRDFYFLDIALSVYFFLCGKLFSGTQSLFQGGFLLCWASGFATILQLLC